MAQIFHVANASEVGKPSNCYRLTDRRLVFFSPSRRAAYGLFSLLALVLVACGNSATPASPTSPPPIAEDFQFSVYQGESRLGGSELNFSDLRGEPVVLNFWAGLCPPCRAEMPEFQEFYDEYGDRVILFGIDVGQFTGLGNREDAEELLAELGVTYPAGVTEDASIMRNYKVLGMPTTVFVRSNGEVFRTWTGVLNLEKLSEITDEMLAEQAG